MILGLLELINSVSQKGLVVIIFTINLYMTHTQAQTHFCSLCSKSRIIVVYYLFIVIYCLFMYFWGDKSSCAMFRGSTMWKCILEKKTCLWFEAAMLEHKSSYVLWPLEGSRRASGGQEFNRKVYLVFYRTLSWLCKVTFFLRNVSNLVCMLKQKHKVHNAREDTLKALYYCNIVDV